MTLNTERIADQTDHFADVFIRENVAYGYDVQSGRVVKVYEYYQTCIATKTFEFFGFLSEARNDTPNLTACCTNVPNLILLKIGHLCSSFVQVFP